MVFMALSRTGDVLARLVGMRIDSALRAKVEHRIDDRFCQFTPYLPTIQLMESYAFAGVADPKPGFDAA